MPNQCPDECKRADAGQDKCTLLISAYILAGLAMMLNIRLSYSSAPYALIRFRLPENLFSVFVRRMASALELWCLPSMLMGNIIDQLQKGIGGDDAFRVKAGKSATEGTLRKLAQELYEKANKLHEAVKKVEQEDGAKVLQAKTGDKEEEGKLRALAKTLHTEVSALVKALKKAGATRDIGELAAALELVIGYSEEAEGLRKALQLLHDARADVGKLIIEAKGVRDNYGHVQNKFQAVKAQASKYTGQQKEFQAVENALTEFDKVYKPEELLRDAIGDKDRAGDGGEPNTLRQALNQLGTATALSPGLSTKAQAVKDKYGNDWSGLKQKYNDVVKQKSAYEKGTTIKSLYDQLEKDWKTFNNAYNTAISIAKFYSITVPSIICQWLNFLTYVVLLIVYVAGGQQGLLTAFYGTIAVSGFVFGINMTLVYAADWNYTPVYIVGENCFPIVTSFIHYLTTLMFGNRRKYNSDYLIVCVDIWVAIIISFTAAVVWTVAYGYYDNGNDTVSYGHIFVEGFDTSAVHWQIVSPTLMVIVGMGLVYAIYPGIAPGMIVPFYLIDKIEMVLLIATFFPPVIIALLNRGTFGDATKPYSPKSCHTGGAEGMGGWRPYKPAFFCAGGTPVDNSFWHFFDILMVIKIFLAVIFIYSLHYRDSNISRSIINQPKMSTALSITFYMCHEILLALGFAGVIANNGGTYVVLPAQYIGALFMIFLAFYSEGYIIEYKSHDPAYWPTEGMWYLYGDYLIR